MQKLKIKLYCLFLGVAFPYFSHSQSFKNDIDLLTRTEFEKTVYKPHKTPFLWVPSEHILLKYNPVSLGFGSLMFLYQGTLSRHFSANCLYSPSCSAFSRELVRDYGLVQGILLTSDRIMRCNRIAASDLHREDLDENDHKVHESTDLYR